jgi:hypothetical protein
MSVHVYGLPTPPRPDVRALSNQRLRALCWRGELPAELLDRRDRERLLRELWAAGWTDVEIATHTHMTTYTTARIRERLGLRAHRARRVPA